MGVQGAPLAGAWRFVQVLVRDAHFPDGIGRYQGYESNTGDLYVYLRGGKGKTRLQKGDAHARLLRMKASAKVGPPGFEPGSIGPKPTSISQTNPRALMSFHLKGSHEGY